MAEKRVILTDRQTGNKFDLSKLISPPLTKVSIGRYAANPISMDHDRISRAHAIVSVENQKGKNVYFIQDAYSRNGTHFIAPKGNPNSTELFPPHKQELAHGQRIWLGSYGPIEVTQKRI